MLLVVIRINVRCAHAVKKKKILGPKSLTKP